MEKQKKVQVGNRNYYINTEKLLDIELNTIQIGMSRKEAKYSEFQKYLIQEGIKQVLFCTGSDEIYDDGVLYRQVSPEMIQFLKDHGLLREINQI